jgi:hypothetical protein
MIYVYDESRHTGKLKSNFAVRFSSIILEIEAYIVTIR